MPGVLGSPGKSSGDGTVQPRLRTTVLGYSRGGGWRGGGSGNSLLSHLNLSESNTYLNNFISIGDECTLELLHWPYVRLETDDCKTVT